MTGLGVSSDRWIAVIGEHAAGSEPHDSIAPAIEHAAHSIGATAPTIRWIATDHLDNEGAELLSGASAVWCAPGGPYRSLDGALRGIRWARESDVPLIGTCAGFQAGVVEFARNILGHASAAHAEYGEAAEDAEFFIDELLCSLVGHQMRVDLIDPELIDAYGTASPVERYYCRFGLHPKWRDDVDRAGLRVAGVDAADGDVRILRLDSHPYFVLTLFVPQTSSTMASPHPLVTRLVTTALDLAAAD